MCLLDIHLWFEWKIIIPDDPQWLVIPDVWSINWNAIAMMQSQWRNRNDAIAMTHSQWRIRNVAIAVATQNLYSHYQITMSEMTYNMERVYNRPFKLFIQILMWFAFQIQQPVWSFREDLPIGGHESVLSGLHSDCSGCHSLCRDQFLYIRNPQEDIPR